MKKIAEFIQEDFLEKGDIWGAFTDINDEGNVISKFVAEPFENGKIQYSRVVNGEEYIFLSYTPGDKRISVMTVVNHSSKNQNTLVSAHLFLAGHKNEVTVNEVIPSGNNYEGYFQIQVSDSYAIPFTLYNPYFAKEESLVRESQKVKIDFAGLALSLEKTPCSPLKINKGDMYKVALKNFLKDNPGKTKKDFPHIEILVNKLEILLPVECRDEYGFQGNINSVEKIKFMDFDVYLLKLCVFKYDNKEFIINLYAPKYAFLDDYKPRTGDNIRGILWLTGYLSS